MNKDNVGALDLNKAADDVSTWNEICGNRLKRIDVNALFNQAKVFKEEALELFEAIQALKLLKEGKLTQEQLDEIEYDPMIETIDGCLDTVFTFTRVVEMLEHFGFDLAEGWEKVVSSNYSKIMDEETAMREIELNKDLTLECERYFGEDYYTLRDSNNKIRKPTSFITVDLSDCVPEDIK